VTEASRPVPQPDAVTQPFWDGIAAGKLRLQRCRGCGRHVFYPRPFCPHCTSADLEWVDASGRGTVHSYTIVHRAPPGFESPYAVALVDLAEGVRMLTGLLDVPPEGVTVGLEVELAVAGDPPLPYFRPHAADRSRDRGTTVI
jgi:uncharacterized OB-fold protein